MEFKYADASKMKTLEDYAAECVMGLLSLQTLYAFQKKALDLGNLKEDQEQNINIILHDLVRLMKSFRNQAESIIELLPEDHSFEAIIEKLKANEIKKAKSIMRKKNE